jgi:hypothetical protein
MQLSRLLLALVVSLRAVLVYGEATSAGDAELTWRQLLPARLRVPKARHARVTATRRYA